MMQFMTCIDTAELKALRSSNEELRQRLAEIEAALPDDYSHSKDWAFDRAPVQRIEWLKSFHKQYKQQVEELSDRIADAERSQMYMQDRIDHLERKRRCHSKYAKRPILYTDGVNGEQCCRDDLWAISTEELNEQAEQFTDMTRQKEEAEWEVDNWKTIAKQINTDWIPANKNLCDQLATANATIEQLQTEVNEQDRLLGISGEKELALLARIERLEEVLVETSAHINCGDYETPMLIIEEALRDTDQN